MDGWKSEWGRLREHTATTKKNRKKRKTEKQKKERDGKKNGKKEREKNAIINNRFVWGACVWWRTVSLKASRTYLTLSSTCGLLCELLLCMLPIRLLPRRLTRVFACFARITPSGPRPPSIVWDDEEEEHDLPSVSLPPSAATAAASVALATALALASAREEDCTSESDPMVRAHDEGVENWSGVWTAARVKGERKEREREREK